MGDRGEGRSVERRLRRGLAVDAQPLWSLYRLPVSRRRSRLIYRLVHGQSDGAAWLFARDPAWPCAHELPQFLLSGCPLAVHRAASGRVSGLSRLDRSKRMSVVVRKPPSIALSETERAFAADVLAGLGAEPKHLPPKYFYDQRGSELFERITRLSEYYPTRTEIGILEAHAGTIAQLIPRDAAVVEFGAGSAAKTRILLDAAPHVSAYVPVDISGAFLAGTAARLRESLPQLVIIPLEADFTKPFVLPAALGARPRIGFFPGSTIGNFEPHEAQALLRHAAAMLGPGALFVIGVDLVKDPDILTAAY